jgi:hypothetical protein
LLASHPEEIEDRMKAISEAELKKAILAVEAERLKHPRVFRPDRAEAAALQENRRASHKILAGFLKEGGLDTRKLQALHDERDAQLERAVERHKADALALAANRKDTLYSSIAAPAKALRDATTGGFFPYTTVSLDTPFLIWSIPLAPIADSSAAPFNSWAKFKFRTSQSRGDQKIGFYFYWVNRYSDYAVINAATFMSATGHLKSHAPYPIGGVNSSEVRVNALFSLWQGWPTGLTSTTSDSAYLGRSAALRFFLLGPDREGSSVSSGVGLHTGLFAVAPSDVVIFEVALDIYFDNDSGNIEADFESGDFQIACPVVVFSLLNNPPAAHT